MCPQTFSRIRFSLAFFVGANRKVEMWSVNRRLCSSGMRKSKVAQSGFYMSYFYASLTAAKALAKTPFVSPSTRTMFVSIFFKTFSMKAIIRAVCKPCEHAWTL